MKKPIILITGGPAFDKRYNLESRMLNVTYPTVICKAGGIPIMDIDNNSQGDYLNLADGVIFTGTHYFSLDTSHDFDFYLNERKLRERKLMQKFIDSGKPIFAICQGFQQINVVLGGDLHFNFKFEHKVEHYNIPHTIKTEKGCLINTLFGKEFLVNSFHNVKIKTLAQSLKPTAFSEDNVIEAFEHKTLPIYGFQWHPERMSGDFHDTPTAPDTLPLFEYFINLCQK